MFRGAVESTKLSHWLAPGSVVALESNLDLRAIGDIYSDPEELADRVVGAVSLVTDIPEDLIRGSGRRAASARQVAMYMIRTHGGLSYPKIGRIFSHDHTTVIYAVNKISRLLAAEEGRPRGVTTTLVKEIESTIAGYLKIVNDQTRDEDPKDTLEAVAITRDGLHGYPSAKIKPLYLKALRIKEPDTLVLEHDKRVVTDELIQRYGELAVLVLNELQG